MAYYNKVGLLVLNDDRSKFLVCEPGQKYKGNVTQYLMPGGQLIEENDIECLKAEIKEELDCEVDVSSLKLIGEYTDVAASHPDRDVTIRLYEGRIVGTPEPSTEIGALHWIDRKDILDTRVSPIIRNKIIPDLIKRGVLSTS